MEKNEFQKILQDELEKEIPSSDINLWLTMRENFVVGKTLQRGEKMNARQLQRVRRVLFTLALFLVLLTLAFTTPHGRTFAQSFFQFFVPAQATSFPLTSTSQPIPTISATEIPSINKSKPVGYISYKTIEEAQSFVDFTIYQLPEDPEGFEFIGVSIQHDMGIVYIHYKAVGPGGGELIITESLSGFPQSPWSEVPPHAVEKVTVNGMSGEYVQGMFVVFPNATSAVWESDAPIFRLRWGDGILWFAIEKHGDVVPIEWLDKDAIIQLAEILMDSHSSSVATNTPPE